MKTRKLGSEGPDVSTIGLGCMGMTVQYGDLDDEQSINTIHHALDVGVNLINSADMYGWGKNEELISIAIKARRNDVILNTKFGQVRNPDGTGALTVVQNMFRKPVRRAYRVSEPTLLMFIPNIASTLMCQSRKLLVPCLD